MKYIKSKLSRQLLSIIVITFSIILLSIGIILPHQLLPIYEKSLYNYLKQPLDFVNENIMDKPITTEMAYIYMYKNITSASDNIRNIIDIENISDVVKLTNKIYGKFNYNGSDYYYYVNDEKSVKRIALTNDNYIKAAEEEVIHNVFPIIIGTFLFVTMILVIWSSLIVRRIENLKSKIDHIDDEDYDHQVDLTEDDEISSLELAIEDIRVSIKNQEEYRNQVCQNISHDFKTPLTVIKSYIEAVEDGVEECITTLPIIKEQTSKLEQKVHSLLYLNKLDYIKDSKLLKLESIDITNVVNSSVNKFRFHNKNLKFSVSIDKNLTFVGTEDAWETIIDNLLSNFIRYAETEIRVNIRKNQITFYNDGPNIDKELIEGIFIPYRKGIKGEFGLGLSIVKKTLSMLGYNIYIKNHNKKGISFIIKKSS
ncbi:MAG: HAMP domain-containing sensor histidine kinase [Bacilli bacterium]|nr:HAMP domain-containing sensor histidine kinase [Bacilli bacterium]